MPQSLPDRTIAEEPRYLITRKGVRLRIRPVKPTDGPILAALLADLSAEDLRFRFLDARKMPRTEEIAAMVEVDHRRNEHVLAFDAATGRLVGSLMMLVDSHMDCAEVAIIVASDVKGHGVGWTLLRHASDIAFVRGVKRLRCIESRDNHDALEVERALGFHALAVEDDPGVMLLESDLDYI